MKRRDRHYKQLYVFSILLVLCVCLLNGCGTYRSQLQDEEKPVILCTTFAAYDWVRNIIGDSDTFSCELLVDSGVDLHSYQPSAQDIVRIAGCRVLVYVGGESDTWVADALRESGNPDIIAVSLLELVGDLALAEVELEGVESHHHHDEYDDHDADDIHDEHDTHDVNDDHDEHDIDDTHVEDDDHDEHDMDDAHDADDGHDHYDEHVWLSLRNAVVTCEALTGVLSELDAEHASVYEENNRLYCEKLAALDAEYTDMIEHAERDTILVGDRFPFLYLAEDYDIHYYAAYSGCSADAEASVHTVVFLAEKLQELQLPVVFVTDSGMPNLAHSIIECAGGNEQVLNLCSMQSVTGTDIEKGCTYLDYMRQNLEALQCALGEK